MKIYIKILLLLTLVSCGFTEEDILEGIQDHSRYEELKPHEDFDGARVQNALKHFNVGALPLSFVFAKATQSSGGLTKGGEYVL